MQLLVLCCFVASRYSSWQCIYLDFIIHYISDIDECQLDACQNNATCIDQVAGYICVCPPGWTGTNCSVGKHFAFQILQCYYSVADLDWFDFGLVGNLLLQLPWSKRALAKFAMQRLHLKCFLYLALV